MQKDIYFKYIKLSSGDSIVCTTTDNCKNIYRKKTITVNDPVVLNPVRMPRGDVLVESYIMYPWFSFSDDTEYKIPTNQVVLVVGIKDGLKKNYLRYLSLQKQDEEETEEFSNDEFDIEEIFLGDENENQENDGDDGTGYRGRTIH